VNAKASVYLAGLDLGSGTGRQRKQAEKFGSGKSLLRHYAVRHLERLPPATRYPEVFSRLTAVFAAPSLHGSKLVADYTGVGRAVLDMLRKAKVGASVTPMFGTTGKNSSDDGRGGWLVSRQELAATLQVLLQSRRLRVAPALPEARMLARELAAFQVKVSTSGPEEMDAWRDGAHDDLVLAVAVAAWVGEHAMLRLRAEHFFL
jgi:hypothetical protein